MEAPQLVVLFKSVLWNFKVMAIRVVEFSSGGYKIRKIFA
jgi:hypothetical protein